MKKIKIKTIKYFIRARLSSVNEMTTLYNFRSVYPRYKIQISIMSSIVKMRARQTTESEDCVDSQIFHWITVKKKWNFFAYLEFWKNRRNWKQSKPSPIDLPSYIITSAPGFVSNIPLHEVLNIEPVVGLVKTHYGKFHSKLLQHPNP